MSASFFYVAKIHKRVYSHLVKREKGQANELSLFDKIGDFINGGASGEG